MKTFEKLKSDIEMVKGLVDKYKPVVQDKIDEYKPVIKKDAEKVKKKYGPKLKELGNSFRKDFEPAFKNSFK